MDSDCALPRAHVPPVTIWYLHDDGVPSEPLAISLRKFRIVEPKCVRTQNHGNMVHPHRVGVGIARLDCHFLHRVLFLHDTLGTVSARFPLFRRCCHASRQDEVDDACT